MRPFQLLFREPIVFLHLGVHVCAVRSTIHVLYRIPYHLSTRQRLQCRNHRIDVHPHRRRILLSAACSPIVNKHYLTVVRKHNGNPPAEARLIPMMVLLLVHSHWTLHLCMVLLPPFVLGRACYGWLSGRFRVYLPFNSANNYLVDSYQHQAASALAARHSLGLSGAPVSFYSQIRCTNAWDTSGQVHY